MEESHGAKSCGGIQTVMLLKHTTMNQSSIFITLECNNCLEVGIGDVVGVVEAGEGEAEGEVEDPVGGGAPYVHSVPQAEVQDLGSWLAGKDLTTVLEPWV